MHLLQWGMSALAEKGRTESSRGGSRSHFRFRCAAGESRIGTNVSWVKIKVVGDVLGVEENKD